MQSPKKGCQTPSPVLDKSFAPVGPDMLSSTWTRVWRRKGSGAIPDSIFVFRPTWSQWFRSCFVIFGSVCIKRYTFCPILRDEFSERDKEKKYTQLRCNNLTFWSILLYLIGGKLQKCWLWLGLMPHISVSNPPCKD